MPDEKMDEKEHEKSEEKSPEEKHAEEKSWDEKYRRDPLSSIVWACILIWAGLVFLAYNLGWLNFRNIPWMPIDFYQEPWSLVLIGAGVIVLIEILIRLLVPQYRRPVGGTFVFAVILISIGVGNIYDISITWPFILIAIGISLIVGNLLRGRSSS
jgi:hypothetical protein